MSCRDKCRLLNELSQPLGFSYDVNGDVFVTRTDALQRSFGYARAYDLAAPSAGMVFDAQPVYFNYRGKTWLIELWKGQYGINTGAEVGVYHADSVVPDGLIGGAVFKAAEDGELLPVKLRLYTDDELLFCQGGRHWWLAGFCMGRHTRPSELTAEAMIAFPDLQMRDAFLQGLVNSGYTSKELSAVGTTARVVFTKPRGKNAVRSDDCALKRYALFKTRLLCRLYLRITSPFECTQDRLLYLYYYLPFAFRRAIGARLAKKRRAGR